MYLRSAQYPTKKSLGNPDGSLAKTDKAKGMTFVLKHFEQDPVAHDDNTRTLFIEDGNALFYMFRSVPDTFDDISESIFGKMNPNSDVLFSTDMSNSKVSIKSSERKRRGTGTRKIISGGRTKKPTEWSSFQKNEENKEQLVAFLKKTWVQTGMPPDY